MKRKKKDHDSWSEVRGHLLVATRELLLSARGVMHLFQEEGVIKNSPQMASVLGKAEKLADTFADGILKTNSFSELAKDMLVPIIRATSKK